jgi:hypothetical protein
MSVNLHAMKPSVDPSWAWYPRTVLELHAPGGRMRVDLRQPISPDVAATLRALGPTATFAIITACNPLGRETSAEENVARTAALRAQLEREGKVFLGADGMSPEGDHREQGFAVWTPQDDAMLIAVEQEQSAIFWFDGEAFWILGAVVKTEPLRLPHPPASE